ncbi:MAG: twin-arginine translocase TatA/TatE family subunit [Verrucomicrobia bacterium]|nr:twin-arginine translocase TatA/TatE family subunit [Verrucomicrobiota bacterium]
MFALLEFGGTQLIVILVLILVFFGARKIPELAKGLGQGIKEFKKATREVSDEVSRSMDETPSHTPPQPKQIQETAQTQKPVAEQKA